MKNTSIPVTRTHTVSMVTLKSASLSASAAVSPAPPGDSAPQAPGVQTIAKATSATTCQSGMLRVFFIMLPNTSGPGSVRLARCIVLDGEYDLVQFSGPGGLRREMGPTRHATTPGRRRTLSRHGPPSGFLGGHFSKPRAKRAAMQAGAACASASGGCQSTGYAKRPKACGGGRRAAGAKKHSTRCRRRRHTGAGCQRKVAFPCWGPSRCGLHPRSRQTVSPPRELS